MKLLFLLLLPVISVAQIPRNAKTIIVKNVSFIEACNKLLDLGYTIDKKDNDLQTATTGKKEYTKLWNAEYDISIRVKDSTLFITGRLTAPPGTGSMVDNARLEHLKSPKHMYTVGFAYLNEFALSFNKPVEYSK